MMVDHPVRLLPAVDTELNGEARGALRDALASVGTPIGVAIVAIGTDGRFASRIVHEIGQLSQFDLFARAEAIMARNKLGMLD